MNSINDSMNKWFESQKIAAARLDNLFEFSKIAVASLDKWFESSRIAAASLDKWFEPSKIAAASFDNWFESSKIAAEMLNKWFEPQKSAAEMFSSWFDSQQSISNVSKGSDSASSDISIDLEKKQISFEQQCYPLKSVQTDIRAVLDEIHPNRSISESLQQIDQRLDEMKKDPLYKQFLKGFLIWFICTYLLQPIINICVARYSPTNKQQAIKQIQQRIASEVSDIHLVKQFRIVTTDRITVRSCRNSRARIVGKLYLGQVVEIVRKDRKWAQVELRDSEGNVQVTGWVFNRRLKKIGH